MINKSTTRRNYMRLLEYDTHVNELADAGHQDELRKMTLNIDWSYHDVVKRMALIEGITKTEVMRRAIDFFAESFGDDVLFPGRRALGQ